MEEAVGASEIRMASVYSRSMDSLGSILPKVLHKRGLHGHARAALVTHRATLWLRAALPAHCYALDVKSVKDGVLTISTGNSIAAQETASLLPALKDFLERECTGAAIREIRMIRSRG